MKILSIFLLFVSSLSVGQSKDGYIDYEHEKSHIGSDVSKEKIMLLSILNEARKDPQTYGKSIDIDLSKYKPMGELTEDKELSKYAQLYSIQLLKDAPVFEHSNMRYHEIIAWSYDPCVLIDQFVIDKGVPDLGHRKEIFTQTHTKVGIGLTKGYVGKWYRSYVVVLFK